MLGERGRNACPASLRAMPCWSLARAEPSASKSPRRPLRRAQLWVCMGPLLKVPTLPWRGLIGARRRGAGDRRPSRFSRSRRDCCDGRSICRQRGPYRCGDPLRHCRCAGGGGAVRHARSRWLCRPRRAGARQFPVAVPCGAATSGAGRAGRSSALRPTQAASLHPGRRWSVRRLAGSWRLSATWRSKSRIRGCGCIAFHPALSSIPQSTPPTPRAPKRPVPAPDWDCPVRRILPHWRCSCVAPVRRK